MDLTQALMRNLFKTLLKSRKETVALVCHETSISWRFNVCMQYRGETEAISAVLNYIQATKLMRFKYRSIEDYFQET